jgi:D-galactarolactone cycloisomerase
MKISAVETIVLSIPFSYGGPGLTWGGKSWAATDILLVKVTTDTGITGWGEAFGYNVIPATKAVIDSLIAPQLVGRDPSQIEPIHLELQKQLHNFGRGGPVMYGIAGIDIALWDIAGKTAGQPLYKLLGGSGKTQIEAYASMWRYSEPALVARNCEAMVKRGYRHVKLHEIGVEQVKAAREAAGKDTRIMVDTNCPWNQAEAIEMARRMAAYDIFWLEEPVWPPENYSGLAAVRAATGIAIAAGENFGSYMDFTHLFKAGAVNYAQPSVTKIGGVTELRKIMLLAEAENIRVMPHTPYFGPGAVAGLHLIAASPQQDMLFERLCFDLEAELFGSALLPVNGRLPVPQAPGLGHDPDPEVIKRYRAN